MVHIFPRERRGDSLDTSIVCPAGLPVKRCALWNNQPKGRKVANLVHHVAATTNLLKCRVKTVLKMVFYGIQLLASLGTVLVIVSQIYPGALPFMP
uniref:hypothetical protein n=1 Tax=Arthrobacter sp. TaxID=1667 RepID=UPI00159EF073|nr:hypothetical protein [Arthrobacter sp.]